MVSPDSPGLVVVGGGQAATQLIEVARLEGYADPITLISEEPVLPYQRPPLSKQYLAGTRDSEWLLYRPDRFYSRNNVQLRLGCRVVELDRSGRCVALEDGSTVSYTKLAMATGVRALRLSVADEALNNVYYIRTLADVGRLLPRLPAVRRVTIIGAGFIGLETAAALVQMGKQVTLLGAQDRVLPKLGCAEISDFLRTYHADNGVDFSLDAEVSAIEERSDGQMQVSCVNGNSVVSDIVIVGIGAVPNIELADAAGLDCDDGILVDQLAITSDPDIVAAGDCTSHPSGHSRQRLRLETVHNAVEQGRTAGVTLAGKQRPYKQAPWVWSDQYGLRIQSVGIAQGFDHSVMRGDPADGVFSVFYFRQDELLAASTVNQPFVFAAARRILNERILLSPAQAADSNFNLAKLSQHLPNLNFEVPWPTREEAGGTWQWGHS